MRSSLEARGSQAEETRHRATSVDAQIREARVDQFLQPLIDQWQNPALGHSLSSFQSFTNLLGLDGLQQYLSARAVQKIPDWSSHPLDDEGKDLQAHMEIALNVSVPVSRLESVMYVAEID